MSGAVEVRVEPARHLAVVRERRAWTDLGAKLLPLLDRVYVAVRAGAIVQSGHNVFVFREPTRDGVTVEIGVEVAAPFAASGDVVSAATPAGEAAVTMHRGPYAGLGAAHDAVRSWCEAQGRERAGVWWEVYGDWCADPAQLETEVLHALVPRGGDRE
ncbi:GyrI-like domain-containing protein [Candidatus Binatia bacterium]|nr:GyrI-like domain-containing protein [Candidatus Binatia bacterium]